MIFFRLFLLLPLFIACTTTPKNHAVDFLITEPIRITPKSIPNDPSEEPERDFDELFRQAGDAFDRGDYDTAEAAYRDILKYNPIYQNTPFCYYNLGLIALRRNDYETAQANFKASYLTIGRRDDKLDALNLYLHSLRKLERWEEIADFVEQALSRDLADADLATAPLREILLRRAEAKAMSGKIEEGRNDINAVLFALRREHPPAEQVFIPELAMAHFVMGRSLVAEFSSFPLESTEASLLRKCTIVQEAQRWFLNAIRVGIIYWTNAAAYELAALYRRLFDEMAATPVPAELSPEERTVYECELYRKTAGLLKKGRRTLLSSIESAKRIHERNELIDESLALLVEIADLQRMKEHYCTARGLTDEKAEP